MTSQIDLAILSSSAELAFASKSLSSTSLREYSKSIHKAKTEYQFMLTDLRDKKSPIEADAGRIFQVQA